MRLTNYTAPFDTAEIRELIELELDGIARMQRQIMSRGQITPALTNACLKLSRRAMELNDRRADMDRLARFRAATGHPNLFEPEDEDESIPPM